MRERRVWLAILLAAAVFAAGACAPGHHHGDDDASPSPDDDNNSSPTVDDDGSPADDDNDDDAVDDDYDLVWSITRESSYFLDGVGGASHFDVFAIGRSNSPGDFSGAALQYNGEVWSSVCGLPETFGLRAVWADSSSNVFVIGNVDSTGNGAILHYDGSIWSKMSVLGDVGDLVGVWGASPSNIFAVGGLFPYLGSIVHFDGNSWTAINGSFPPLAAVWGVESEAFAGGADGDTGRAAMFRYDGSKWSPIYAGTDADHTSVWGIWGTSSSDVFAVGAGDKYGLILHYSGLAWSVMSNDEFAFLNSVWGSSHTDIFAVGGDAQGNGTIIHYDGTSWSVMLNGPVPNLYGVWGSSPADIFAVGYDYHDGEGVILHYGPKTGEL